MLAMAALSTAFASDFFPIQAGNTWTYRDAQTGHAFTIRVGDQVVREGQTYNTLEGYTPQRLLVRMTDFADLVYFDETLGHEMRLTRFSLAMEPFHAPQRGCDMFGRLGGQIADHDGPAGRFRSVMQIFYEAPACPDAGIESEQYATNIGMLQRVVGSLAGPRTYKLISARIGNFIVEGGVFGRFTVSAAPVNGTDTLEVTLRLRTGAGPAVKLEFPSAQQYDVAIRDSNGRRIWTWSQDKLFALTPHELLVAGEWTETLQVPKPRTADNQYFIDAWLTTAPDTARYAATAPLKENENQ
jgi:hypothetical protein